MTVSEGPMGENRLGGKDRSVSLWRMLPLAVLFAAGAIAWFGFDVGQYISFEALKENREWLLAQVEQRAVAAALVFMTVYALTTAFSIPGGAVLTVLGGFLFGTWLGMFYVVFGATLGAIAVFLAARTALGAILRARVGGALNRMERGFRENALSYMLVLRLIPVFPFWLVNLVPAFFGVRLGTYVVTTLVGIVPGTVVYTSVGNGLGATLDAGADPDLGAIFQPAVFLPLVGLGLLSLVPVVYKRIKARKG